MSNSSAVIYGCAGMILSDAEIAFFTEKQPLGFILFARNCESPEQIKALTDQLRSTVKHKDVPVLIDQEGGRVARLRPPHWRAYPAAQAFVDQSKQDSSAAERACYINAKLIAQDLDALGINTNCAPCADLRLEDAHDIIGDRAFGRNADEIVPLARAQAQGLMDGGVMPVLKHIPGHGRALVDSHLELPTVKESLDILEKTDFEPFKQLSDLPMGMTAHIRYEAIDAEQPATLSAKVISLVREKIGFDGLLMSDDISMKALNGDLAELSAQALGAGCDIVLHCNGKMDEMVSVASGVRPLTNASMDRVGRAFDSISNAEAEDESALLAELDALHPNLYAA